MCKHFNDAVCVFVGAHDGALGLQTVTQYDLHQGNHLNTIICVEWTRKRCHACLSGTWSSFRARPKPIADSIKVLTPILHMLSCK